jgi:hypothetical protein
MQWKKQTRLLAALIIMGVVLPLRVAAQTSSSGSYRVEEAFFGTGGEVNLNSNSYNAQGGLGSLGVGNTSSTNFDATAGFLTPGEPYLEFVINTSTVDLGTLTTTSTGTGTATFYVRTYLSGTYSVVTLSQPPTSEGGSVLDAKTTLGASQQGTEEFGINVVDNSSPDIGANPVNVPDNTFADGQAATGYSTVNSFKYGVGDSIARSQATVGNQAIGQTNYTISYIANVSGVTPAGSYTMVHDLMAVATY